VLSARSRFAGYRYGGMAVSAIISRAGHQCHVSLVGHAPRTCPEPAKGARDYRVKRQAASPTRLTLFCPQGTLLVITIQTVRLRRLVRRQYTAVCR
jgi:hypothetical protein